MVKEAESAEVQPFWVTLSLYIPAGKSVIAPVSVFTEALTVAFWLLTKV